MLLAAILETLILAAVAIVTIRGTRPAAPPHGRRLVWTGVLLILQLAAFYVFLWIHMGTGWGLSHTRPPGLAFLTQCFRLGLLLLAGRAWLAMALEQLPDRRQRLALAVAFAVLALSGNALAVLAALGLFLLLQRMPWVESVRGWRRVAGFLVSAVLLILLSIVPATSIVAGRSNLQVSLGSTDVWPPALLSGGVAATELALTRPLDRAVQAIIDLFRIQLLVVAIKSLFLPIRLSGMSLKRRFWINYALVRSIPAMLSWLVLLGMGYLALGYTKSASVRAVLEQTLARAATAAHALGDGAAATGDPDRLARLRAWMAPDGDSAIVVERRAGALPRATPGTPEEILRPALSDSDTTVTRGLYVRGGRIYLAAVGRSERGAIEVWVPVDTSYLARVMRGIGGSARLTAQPNVFVGSEGLRMTGDTSWIEHPIVVRAPEPPSLAGRGTPWFLNRLYLPAGDWQHASGWTGGVELTLESTPRSLVRNTVRSFNGIYSNVFLLLLLAGVGMLVGMVEGFAVRSGKSIVQAVLDEIGGLRQAAVEFGAGNLGYRLPVKGRDEIGVVATSFNDMAANLQRQQAELIVAERLEQDMAVARQIQQRFLPQQAPTIAGLDVAGVSIPSKAVGGDLFYWFSHEGRALGFVLGDVAGKSVPAALLMSNVLAALRVQADERVELAATLERANRLIVDQIEPGRFVTLFYGEAEPARGTLRYVSAGHNPPLLLRDGAEPVWLREGGVPLGILPEATYQTTTLDLVPGDTLIVYSDGVTESEGPGRDGKGGPGTPELFGEERLASLAQELRGQSARAVLESILAAVRRFADGVEQADDITIVVVRRT